MGTQPTGAEAAAEFSATRIRLMHFYVDDVERELRQVTDDPTEKLADVWAATTGLRRDPLDYAAWEALCAQTHAARAMSTRGDAASLEQWDRIHQTASQGRYKVMAVIRVQTSNAPICDEHGAMTKTDGTWDCSARANCSSSYTWLDGTHCRRD